VTFRITQLTQAVCTAALAAATLGTSAETIELTNGDVLTGKVVAQTETDVTLDHAILGEIVIERSRVSKITPEGAKPNADAEPSAGGEASGTDTSAKPAPDAAAKKIQEDVEKAAAEADNPFMSFLSEWNSRLTLGLNGSEGNTERQNYRVMINARQTKGRDRWDFNSRWVQAYANGRQNQSQFETNLTREWLQEDSPWFFFVKGQYKYDIKRSYQNRTSGFGGGGYTLAATDDLEVNTRMGFGGTYEYGSVNEFTPEALFGGSVVSWKVNERSSFAGETLFYPSLENGDDYRVESTLEWVYKLDVASGLSFKVGLENEYNSDSPNDTSNNDLKYYGAVVLSF